VAEDVEMEDGPAPYELPDARVSEAWGRLIGEYLVVEELEPELARRILDAEPSLFAELGSATGPISRLLDPAGVSCVAVDLNPPADAFSPMVRADLRSLPLVSGSVDAVSAVNCLYFLADPAVGVQEARRLLRPGGLFLAGVPSRYHDPELRHVLPDWGQRSPFDAEEAGEIVASVGFSDVEIDWWEAPAYLLRDHDAVVDYLVAFKVPDAERRATEVTTPTYVTKSGVNVWATR
jgi:SAM-dependent methyltransferase